MHRFIVISLLLLTVPQPAQAGKVITLLDEFTCATTEIVEFPSIALKNFREIAFLGRINENNAGIRLEYFFSNRAAMFSDPTVPRTVLAQCGMSLLGISSCTGNSKQTVSGAFSNTIRTGGKYITLRYYCNDDETVSLELLLSK